jgi:exodeoxyribonuclease VII small subunit
MAGKKATYSESVKELEDILAKLENNDVALEDLAPTIKKASEIIKRCKQQLFDTDTEIKKLLDDIQI